MIAECEGAGSESTNANGAKRRLNAQRVENRGESGTRERSVEIEDCAGREIGFASILKLEDNVVQVECCGAVTGAGDPGGLEFNAYCGCACTDGDEKRHVSETGAKVDERVGFSDGCRRDEMENMAGGCRLVEDGVRVEDSGF